MNCGEMNTLKTVTPNGITSKSLVHVTGCKSNFGYDVPTGFYYLDSFDECDGTCFIAVKLDHIPKKPHKASSTFTYGISLDAITSLDTMFGDTIAKAVEELDDKPILSIVNQIPHCEFRVETFKSLTKIQKKLKKGK